MEVVIRPNAEAAADLVARVIAQELRSNPRLVMGLATGNTMEAVYARLVRMHGKEGLDFSACGRSTLMNMSACQTIMSILTGTT